MSHSTLDRTGGRPHVAVIGAGIGGLSSAMGLIAAGAQVTVLERSDLPGGKMRRESVGNVEVDAGPTVLTMLEVFERLFASVGRTLQAELRVHSLDRLARHAWPDGTRLDLYRDEERSAHEIESVFGRSEALAYRRFTAHCRAVYARVKGPFMESGNPGVGSAWRAGGFKALSDMMRVDWHRSMWGALRSMLKTPHLRQLFARYATYYGSSPYAAPATLNLIAEVEREGVWVVEGGMHTLAQTMLRVLRELGAEVEFGSHVSEIRPQGGCWDVSTDASTRRFDAVVFNGDTRSFAQGYLGEELKHAVAPVKAAPSASALTWCIDGELSGKFDADFHNVFFSENYRAEFDAVFGSPGRLADEPTVYLCAQSRAPGYVKGGEGAGEPLFLLANAPAAKSGKPLDQQDIQRCEDQVHRLMQRCGLQIQSRATSTTRPMDFARRFPGSQGALYGTVTHSPFAPFSRATSRSRLPGLYLAGGGIHPGAGVPMAAMSGNFAAQAIAKDLALTPRFAREVTFGGTSTSFPTTVSTR